MDLSLIIPLYNAEPYAAKSASMVHAFLTSLAPRTFELIFVDDGSQDRGADCVQALGLPSTTVIRLPCNLGKFGAIKAGMRAATGRCRIFTDGDIPYELGAIEYISELILSREFHLAIGDRTLAGSEYSQQLPFVRSVVTRLFTQFVRVLVAGGLFDTQCGIKGFRGDVADALFPLVRDQGFSGDVELLYIALKYNLEIKRVPVRLRRQAPSTVRVSRDGLKMLRRISKLRKAWRRGYYHSAELVSIADQSYWNTDSSSGISIDTAPDHKGFSKVCRGHLKIS
ncbi:MAG: glycosyltransferase [Pseudomonadota bacterium]|jgi:dolichyl-phosphate beta-glucosyltransferase